MPFAFNFLTLSFRLISLTLIVLAITLLSGCATNSEKLFPDVYKPRIAIITSVPDEIYINYIGPMTLNNRSSALATDTDLNRFITSELITIFNQENIAEVVNTDDDDLKSLQQALGSSLEKHWYTPPSDSFLATISEWGKVRDIEYALLVTPGRWATPNRLGYPLAWHYSKGIGIHVTEDITYHHSVYDFRLIDIKNASVHRHERAVTLQNVPVYRRSLSEQERVTALRNWENRKQRTYQPTDDIYTPDMYLDFFSRYKGDDFLNLSSEQISQIYIKLIPVIKEEIRQNLIDMGLLPGRKSGNEHMMEHKGSEPFKH
jgi:hypothetical protein